MSEWGNPLKRKQPKKEKEEKPVKVKELPLFKKEKLTLTKSEAKKVLAHSGDLSYSQIGWTQRWLDQKIRERSLPPQLSGHDAFGQIALFLPPSDALALLDAVRSDFQRLQWASQSKDDELPLQTLENEAYHEYLLQPHTSSHNTDLSDDDL